MTSKADLTGATWTKSSFSSGGTNCVEVAFVDGVTAIRDSKDPRRGTLAVSAHAFAALINAVTVAANGLSRSG